MFKLVPNPTFVADVEIPVAGGTAEVVKLTFKHRSKDELIAWREKLAGRKDLDLFLEMVDGWSITEDFTKANVELLLQNYQGVAWNAYAVYVEELTKHREKNS
ncbi:phage tail assembly chaperone [Variovorax sp. UMC13]|uniref:phage tail assembly chaperone n=1 Tax=Variovorax sp. UMC13 TaxID=1862326 RepID=UPI0016029913|nr:phage tail assembly chaperone [Variovorax sp. UMC13]MBB1599478.1 hypothetical protein [Variovorax sp. UMC13]